MIGVSLDNLEKIIKKNNANLQSLDSNLKKIKSVIDDLNSCYSGRELEYLFIEPAKQKTNIGKISDIVKNYSDVLYGVECSYKSQDLNLTRQINHINSDI